MRKFILIIASITLLWSFSSIGLQVFGAVTAPNSDLKYSDFVICDGVVNKNEPNRNVVCSFSALLKTINSIISYMFYISIPIAVILFAYGGLLYLTGKEKNITDAKKMFITVGQGFVIMLIAWVAVYTVVNWLVKPGSGVLQFLTK